jgi:excisionase family DNA binding protein
MNFKGIISNLKQDEETKQQYKLCTKQQVMDMLGISISKMDTLIRKKEIKYIKLGRQVRFNEYDVMDYVKGCEVN